MAQTSMHQSVVINALCNALLGYSHLNTPQLCEARTFITRETLRAQEGSLACTHNIEIHIYIYVDVLDQNGRLRCYDIKVQIVQVQCF